MNKDYVLTKFLKGLKPFEEDKIKKIYLFGSRARGTERPDSDYDLLLVVRQDFSLADKDKLYERVMDTLLETGRLVSLKIFKEKEFKRLCDLETPFTRTVLKEGIEIG